MSLPGNAVNVQDIYENGLWNQAFAAPTTLEILNGGLDASNVSLPNFVPTWAIQPGALVSGVYMPFERWEYVYGSQVAGKGAGASIPDLAIPVGGLCARVFKPWDANFIIIGYQAFFQHDARSVVASNTPDIDDLEFWRAVVHVGGNYMGGLDAVLPYGASQNPLDHSEDQATYMNENRWRFVSKTHGFKRGVAADSTMDKGYLNIKVSLWAYLRAEDRWKCKCKIPTGGLWIMAFR
jgi:hypothetical protein